MYQATYTHTHIHTWLYTISHYQHRNWAMILQSWGARRMCLYKYGHAWFIQYNVELFPICRTLLLIWCENGNVLSKTKESWVIPQNILFDILNGILCKFIIDFFPFYDSFCFSQWEFGIPYSVLRVLCCLWPMLNS